jgi:hypothetical protein
MKKLPAIAVPQNRMAGKKSPSAERIIWDLSFCVKKE